jgi:hypothetical protein
LRALIRQMSTENLLWGAPRIHGEVLKLGFEVAQSSVAGPPSQGWRIFPRNHAPEIAAMDLFVVPIIRFHLRKTFLHNHADGIASIDLFVVPTISFRLLYGC